MCREGIRFFSTLLIGVALNNSKMQPRIEMLDALGCYEGGWKDGEFHNPEGLASDSAGICMLLMKRTTGYKKSISTVN